MALASFIPQSSVISGTSKAEDYRHLESHFGAEIIYDMGEMISCVLLYPWVFRNSSGLWKLYRSHRPSNHGPRSERYCLCLPTD
jgi:hypothetical protein